MSILSARLSGMIAHTILHSLWQITLLWIALMVVLRLCPKASSSVRYALALATLFGAVLVTTSTAVYQWNSHPIADIHLVGFTGTTSVKIEEVQVRQTFISQLSGAVQRCLPVLPWIWCAGLLFMSIRFTGSLVYVRTLRNHSETESILPELREQLSRLSHALGLHSEVTVAMSTRITTPITLGTFSPIILLPGGMLSGMSTAQMEAILIHELYHIKRFDYLINLGQALAEVAMFYHPAIWHLNSIIRDERENTRDDETLRFCGDAITYARALTKIQELNSSTKPILAMSATGSNPGKFTARIKRLFHSYPDATQHRSKGIFAIGFLILYLGVAITSAQVSTAQTTEYAEPFFSTHAEVTLPEETDRAESFPKARREENEPISVINAPQLQKQKVTKGVDIETARKGSLDECIDDLNNMMRDVHLGNPMLNDTLRLAASKDYAKIRLTPDEPGFTQGRGISIRTIRTQERNDTVVRAKVQQEVKPLFTINGTVVGKSQSDLMLRQIEPSTIESITVYKNQDAIDLFGEQGKDGVIAITLKAGVSIPSLNTSVDVEVFPNRAKDHIKIRFTPTQNKSRVKMVLTDSSGNVTAVITDSHYDAVPTELNVNVNDYIKGLYILQIDINGNKSQQRIILE